MNTSSPNAPGNDPENLTVPLNSERVDEVLSENLTIDMSSDVTWKEPERSPRWYERNGLGTAIPGSDTVFSEDANVEDTRNPIQTSHVSADTTASTHLHKSQQRLKPFSLVFGAFCCALGLWALAAVGLGLYTHPLALLLGTFVLAGVGLVVSGLLSGQRERRGRRARRL